jgi:hypothetical protein
MAEEIKDKVEDKIEDKKDQIEDKVNPEDKIEDKKEPKMLSEEEVNAIVQQRVNKTKEKYADYDDLKTKIATFEAAQQEKERAEMTEIERLKADLDAKEQEETTYKQQLETLQTQLKQDRIDRAFEAAAKAAGIEYIDQAKKLANMEGITVEDSDIKGVDEVIKSLVETSPFLVAPTQEQKKIGGATNNAESKQSDKSSEELLRAAAEKARRTGRVEDKIAYVQLKAELGK